MADIFLQKDLVKLLRNKRIVLMGDSNVRAVYKDVLCLSKQSKFCSDRIFKTKMENSVFGDKLVHHGPRSNGRDYREEREAISSGVDISFYFLTRVYSDYVEKILKNISNKCPDILVIGSCVWDVTRWGPQGVQDYKSNLKTLLKQIQIYLPKTLFIWLTAPPIAVDMKGGFLIKELQFLKYSLRFHIMEANQYARKIVVASGFDVLDVHYHLRMQIHRRTPDGIHWFPRAVRYVTNLLLTHISLALGVELPHRYESTITEQTLEAIADNDCLPDTVENKLPIKKNKSTENRKLTVVSNSDKRVVSCDKENHITPKRKAKKKRKGLLIREPNKKSLITEKSTTTVKETKKESVNELKRTSIVKETYHEYSKRKENAERRRRIKKWLPASSTSSPFVNLVCSPIRSHASLANEQCVQTQNFHSPIRPPSPIRSQYATLANKQCAQTQNFHSPIRPPSPSTNAIHSYSSRGLYKSQVFPANKQNILLPRQNFHSPVRPPPPSPTATFSYSTVQLSWSPMITKNVNSINISSPYPTAPQSYNQHQSKPSFANLGESPILINKRNVSQDSKYYSKASSHTPYPPKMIESPLLQKRRRSNFQDCGYGYTAGSVTPHSPYINESCLQQVNRISPGSEYHSNEASFILSKVTQQNSGYFSSANSPMTCSPEMITDAFRQQVQRVFQDSRSYPNTPYPPEMIHQKESMFQDSRSYPNTPYPQEMIQQNESMFKDSGYFSSQNSADFRSLDRTVARTLLRTINNYKSPIYSPSYQNHSPAQPYSPSFHQQRQVNMTSPCLEKRNFSQNLLSSQSPSQIPLPFQAYTFPNVDVTQTLQPNINFASTDSMPFGVHF
ncbi:uncharacterized protein LOC118186335 [Stegodyphus dumicola]|uniref:uncharacterized protein LOC118186335 n=1 Tax=Stegodyphus dumicola TaxID=202533 RepID=UPI0015A78D87|nr:uncharacterized protein LOC118186335 [Stegodyphus dumicola]